MLTFNAISFYEKITKKLGELDEFMKYINNNIPKEEKSNIIKNILSSDAVSTGGKISYITKLSADAGEILKKDYMVKYDKFKKDFDVIEFNTKSNNISNDIKNLFIEYEYEDSNIVKLLNDLIELSKKYNNIYRSNDSKESITNFFIYAEEVTLNYYNLLNNIRSFIKSLSNNYIDEDTDEVLEIQLLGVEYSVCKFGNLLLCLDKAYNSIASLFFTQIETKSLKVVKIESGSLLSKVLGDKNILEIITIILKRISDSLYHRFMKEGKLELNSTIMKEIEQDIEIIKKLEEAGIDVEQSKINIASALNSATKELADIASSTPKMKINNEEITIVEVNAFLEYKRELLENNKEDN